MKFQIDTEKKTISFPKSTTQSQINQVFELFELSESKWQIIMVGESPLSYYLYSNSTEEINNIKPDNYYTTISY